jgi:hypothetical protein
MVRYDLPHIIWRALLAIPWSLTPRLQLANGGTAGLSTHTPLGWLLKDLIVISWKEWKKWKWFYSDSAQHLKPPAMLLGGLGEMSSCTPRICLAPVQRVQITPLVSRKIIVLKRGSLQKRRLGRPLLLVAHIWVVPLFAGPMRPTW